MILRKLIAHGFKSFADKTEFDFDRGVTGIVGPNGCGKSNVVDAIRWVLGEQSAKSLRGKQMLDIIFNGSGTRKSAGLAQVDLVFDNSDGKLPLDQAEVVVTRRLFRSGESEYLLNKQACRLRDIKELFMDTGVGIDAYSVIEQGRVDALLQANPVERRLIFEEAAGISKFKARKKEAQRKLERVDQNLLRLQDLVDEIEKRLRSIKLAAGKARSYQQYTARLRELRSRYVLASYHEQRQQQTALERQAAELSDQSTGLRTTLSESETRSEHARVEALSLDSQIAAADAKLRDTQAAISAHEERLAAARQRIVDRTQAVDRVAQRIAALESRLADVRQQESAAGARMDAADEEVAALQRRVAEVQAEEAACNDELRRLQRSLDDEKAGVIDLLRRTASLQNEINSLGARQSNLTGLKDRLAVRDSEVRSHLADLMQRRGQLESRREQVLNLIEDQSKALDENRARAVAVAERRSQRQERIAAAKEYRSGLQSRQRTLEELDRRREGLTVGSREVLARRDADSERRAFEYVLGPVGELFEVESKHASIIETVLGEFEQYLVVAARDALLADRDSLAQIEGRVLAFALDHVPAPISIPEMGEQPGVIAVAADWVRAPESCDRLRRHLLGRTLVVESIEDARRLAGQFPQGIRFVTLDGVVCEPDGRVAMGALGVGTGLISRRSELRELTDQIAEVEVRVRELQQELTDAEQETVHLDQVQQNLRTAYHEADRQRVEITAHLSSVTADVERLSREQPIIAQEAETLAAELADAQIREQSHKSELVALEETSAERHRRIDTLQADINARQARVRTLAEQTTQARVAAGEANQRRAALTEALQQLRDAAGEAARQLEAAVREQQEIATAIEEARSVVAHTDAGLSELRSDHANITRQAGELRSRREQLMFDLEQQTSEQRHLRSDLESVESELNERRVKLSEIRVRIEDLVTRTREELSVDLAEQYANYTPEQEQDWNAVAAEIEDLRGKIERLGNVNLDAITEQEELEQRLGFLTGQRDDLRESQRQLATLIGKLDDESKQRFAETFEHIRNHFGDLFRKLFGGGKADITLQDANDVLECGIEIMARPPGKELRSIALLSGGEKTMTAIALLMAIFKTRPSPFTLLDEVDAALDEANNERFNRVIREFLEYSQFIIITHSKRTMSIADTLYGVTMQEAGVSKRVAVKLEDHAAEPERQSAVA